MNNLEKSAAVGNPAKFIKEIITVRKAGINDIETIMPIFDHARKKMRESGNTTQWINGYPTKEIITTDIKKGDCYVIESGKGIIGVFTFIVGDEPNYSEIIGEWPDNNPYGTIHRIASAPGAKGIADTALDFCKKAGVNIRIDTHSDNTPMLGWIGKRGFIYCGIIHVEDGTPRKAFQLNV